jgi:hypothetical protein
MEAEAAFVGGTGLLFLGVDVEERAVDVDGDVTGRRCSPDVLPCGRHPARIRHSSRELVAFTAR